jgi:hypothetical protein
MRHQVSDYLAMNYMACASCLERGGCEAQRGMVFTTMAHVDMHCDYCGAKSGTIHLRFCQPKDECIETTGT